MPNTLETGSIQPTDPTLVDQKSQQQLESYLNAVKKNLEKATDPAQRKLKAQLTLEMSQSPALKNFLESKIKTISFPEKDFETLTKLKQPNKRNNFDLNHISTQTGQKIATLALYITATTGKADPTLDDIPLELIRKDTPPTETKPDNHDHVSPPLDTKPLERNPDEKIISQTGDVLNGSWTRVREINGDTITEIGFFANSQLIQGKKETKNRYNSTTDETTGYGRFIDGKLNGEGIRTYVSKDMSINMVSTGTFEAGREEGKMKATAKYSWFTVLVDAEVRHNTPIGDAHIDMQRDDGTLAIKATVNEDSWRTNLDVFQNGKPDSHMEMHTDFITDQDQQSTNINKQIAELEQITNKPIQTTSITYYEYGPRGEHLNAMTGTMDRDGVMTSTVDGKTITKKLPLAELIQMWGS